MKKLAQTIAKTRQKLREMDEYLNGMYTEVRDEFERSEKAKEKARKLMLGSESEQPLIDQIERRMHALAKRKATPEINVRIDELAKLMDWIDGEDE